MQWSGNVSWRSLKKDVSERDETIGEKEKRIFELKRKTQVRNNKLWIFFWPFFQIWKLIPLLDLNKKTLKIAIVNFAELCNCVLNSKFHRLLQELEKVKFVLDFKIKDLKQTIEPRELELQNAKLQIANMEKELER